MNLPRALSELYPHMKRALWAAGISTADRDARVIIYQNTGHDWSAIIARGDEQADDSDLESIAAHMQRRIDGEPLSRIYGERQFWGLNFKICEDTLDPRPDTETLVDAVLRRFDDTPPETVLDLGTGSGCILIALLSEYRQAQGVGIDKSLNAVKSAKENASLNNVAERAHFYCGSWGQALNNRYDLIISNPPYIPNQVIPTLAENVQNYDPILALDGGEDGLDAYRDIFTEMPKRLNEGGTAFFEIGYNQEKDVVRLVEDSGLLLKAIYPDLAGLPRVVEISCGDK